MPVVSLTEVLSNLSPERVAADQNAHDVLCRLIIAIFGAHGFRSSAAPLGPDQNAGATAPRGLDEHPADAAGVSLYFAALSPEVLMVHALAADAPGVVHKLGVAVGAFALPANSVAEPPPAGVLQPLGRWHVRVAEFTCRVETHLLFRAAPVLLPTAHISGPADLPGPLVALVLRALDLEALGALAAACSQLTEPSLAEACKRPARDSRRALRGVLPGWGGHVAWWDHHPGPPGSSGGNPFFPGLPDGESIRDLFPTGRLPQRSNLWFPDAPSLAGPDDGDGGGRWCHPRVHQPPPPHDSPRGVFPRW